ncbi:hypothetical protein [Vibrio aerogenes]|uniref:hypothetical protein n=1 Tax=Vibrio aerogenes TaxID=92172 RepID=UPI0021C382A6|nr:hypothetical protein [Vibrio aerogenes]
MNHNETQDTERKDKSEWEIIEEEIQKAPEIFRWQIKVDSARSGKFGRKIQNGMAIIMFVLALFFGWMAVRGDNWTGFWVVGGAGVLMTFFVRFLWMADSEYNFLLTEKGIYYTQQQIIPEIAYKIVRVSAWVGIGVCVLAAALVGPLAFVGAGAFALMSFNMTNFSSSISDLGILFKGNYTIIHLEDQEVIELFTDALDYHYMGTIFCKNEQKDELFQSMQSVLGHVDIVGVKRFKDIGKYMDSLVD